MMMMVMVMMKAKVKLVDWLCVSALRTGFYQCSLTERWTAVL